MFETRRLRRGTVAEKGANTGIVENDGSKHAWRNRSFIECEKVA
jgi:hypothetical protein